LKVVFNCAIINSVKKMTLANLNIGAVAKVSAVSGSSSVTKRLMEMGVVPGVSIRVVKVAPFGCPMEVRVRGFSLAIRRSEAETIEISE
jgi:ferrous iron transport protein A